MDIARQFLDSARPVRGLGMDTGSPRSQPGRCRELSQVRRVGTSRAPRARPESSGTTLWVEGLPRWSWKTSTGGRGEICVRGRESSPAAHQHAGGVMTGSRRGDRPALPGGLRGGPTTSRGSGWRVLPDALTRPLPPSRTWQQCGSLQTEQIYYKMQRVGSAQGCDSVLPGIGHAKARARQMLM